LVLFLWLCTLQYSKWALRFEKFFFILIFFYCSFGIASEKYFPYFVKKQTITEDINYVIFSKYVNDFYSVELIASSTPSMKFYSDLLIANNLPIDLAVIPLLESGNNPNAASNKKALGLWQFIPSTAREWSLKRVNGLDERTDVIKSTISALSYLNFLFNDLKDWNLTLIAYNWGIGSVKKSIKKGLIKNGVINLSYLPKETQKYLINFHHLNYLIRKHSNDILEKYPNEEYLKKIKQPEIKKYLESNGITNVSEDLLRHINGYDIYNPVHQNREVLVPSKVFANYFDLKKISYSWNNGNKESHCTIKTYLAQRNDSVVKIVRKFKISIDDFNEMNPAVKYIRPGMKLIICK